MKNNYSKKPSELKEIAMKRVKKLFEEADSVFTEDSELSNRYVALARKISMRFKLKIPAKLKRKYCKHCYSYLRPGKTCRVRIQNDKVVYYCLNCKKYMRFPYK